MKFKSGYIPLLALAALLFCAAPAGADTIYVGDYGGTILKYNPNGTGSVFGTAAGNGPFGMAADAAGNIYVSLNANNTIQKFNTSGVATTFATTGLNGPFGIAFGGSNLYVANSGTASIMKYDTNGVGTTFATAGLGYPFAVAFDHSNNLYVANSGNPSYSILKYTPAGAGSTFIANLTYGPQGIAFDKAGNLYVVESTMIMEYDLNANGHVFASGLSQPESIAFDSGGNLFVADYGSSQVLEYNPQGVESVFATLPESFNGPVGLVVVPEPSTWTMMALGMAIILGAARIRRTISKRLRRLVFAE